MHHIIKKIFMVFIILGMAFGFLNGCDSGDKVIDKATGNQALEQYKVTKDKLKTIEEKQKEQHKDIQEDKTPENN